MQRFCAIAISENTSKQDVDDSKEETYRGVPLQQIWMPINGSKEEECGGAGVAIQKKTKWITTKTLLQAFSRYSEWVLF